MKQLFYNDFKLGVFNGNAVVDATSAVSSITHTWPRELLKKLMSILLRRAGKPREIGNFIACLSSNNIKFIVAQRH